MPVGGSYIATVLPDLVLMALGYERWSGTGASVFAWKEARSAAAVALRNEQAERLPCQR
jgi:hypothetical protein